MVVFTPQAPAVINLSRRDRASPAGWVLSPLCPGHSASMCEVAMLGDASERRMSNGFARVWQVVGNACRGLFFQFAATFNGAGPNSFLSFLCGEVD